MTPLMFDNDPVISLTEAHVLMSEIDRLRAKIAELEARAAELDRLAYRDSLVDLLNRRGFLGAVKRVISRVELYGESAAVLFVDVDNLKPVNDEFGHKAGDLALIEVARLIVRTVRKTDSVGRLGGDEFGIVLEGVDELAAWQMGLRIVEAVVASDLRISGRGVPLCVAVGVGIIQSGDTPETVCERADQQMYRIKKPNLRRHVAVA